MIAHAFNSGWVWIALLYVLGCKMTYEYGKSYVDFQSGKRDAGDEIIWIFWPIMTVLGLIGQIWDAYDARR